MFTNRRCKAVRGSASVRDMLALLLLLHHALAKETPEEKYVIEKINTCPDIGYYFKRESKPNTIVPSCHLCFCRDNGTAVCWPRENSRCNEKYYHHFGSTKRDNRKRRSPGFSDVFFRDAARDVFSVNLPQQCKPYESSYSDGCPPADWCIGCTVCDCDSNGQWNCHVLSFCPDDKGKKKMRKRRGSYKNSVIKRQSPKKKPTPKTTRKPNKKQPPKKANKQPPKNANKQPPKKANKQSSKGKKPQPKQNISHMSKLKFKGNKGTQKKTAPIKKGKPQIQKKKPPPQQKGKSNTKIIGKPKQALSVRKSSSKVSNTNDGAMKNVANTILKKVMASVEKIVSESYKNVNSQIQGKILQKRSMQSNDKNGNKQKNTKPVKYKKQHKGQKITKNNKKYFGKGAKRRSKRDIASLGYITNTTNIKESNGYTHVMDKIGLGPPISKLVTKSDYFQYSVDFKIENIKENGNINETQKDGLNYSTINPLSKVEPKGLKFFKDQNLIENVATENRTKSNLTNKFIKLCKNETFHSDNIYSLDNITISTNKPTCGGVCELRRVLKKIIGFGGKDPSVKTKNKVKKINFFKNLKKIFRKIFQKPVENKNSTNIRQNFRKRNFIRTICKNIGPCKADPTNKFLSTKLNQLKLESNKILKSVRSIKGLLKLLDKDINTNGNLSDNVNKENLNNDIKKINAIIKNVYNEHNFDNLTDRQRTQITYIKQNTRIFMNSLENFARILNDVIQILTNRKINYPTTSQPYLRSPYNDKIYKSRVNTNDTVGDKLNKIITLLIKYNLVQNRFMKQMYDILITLDPKKVNTTFTEDKIKVSNDNKRHHDTIDIQNYTKYIIENLRKLKNLVERLSFKNRRKRSTTEDDDVMQYFLLLMEYMLKNNRPLTTSPVEDDIDLLIEAIKSAPDIKTTKKKVLDYTPVYPPVKHNTKINDINLRKINNTKDGNKDSNNFIAAKFKTFQSIDEDDEDSDMYQYNKKLSKSDGLKTENNKKIDRKYDIITTTSSDGTLGEDEKTNVILISTNEKKDEGNRYEVFFDDTDEDEGAISSTTKMSEIHVETSTAPIGPQRTTFLDNSRDERVYDNINNTFKSESKRLKLDWIEENFNQDGESRELPRYFETTTQNTPTTQMMQMATRTVKQKGKLDKYVDPISSMSREVEEERPKQKKVNSEYVMYKKQMNLLNSLDYGTERSEMDADSKEDLKYTLESFPMYIA